MLHTKIDIGDDFIGVFDGGLSSNFCKSLIKYYEDMDKKGFSYDRQTAFNRLAHVNKDQSVDLIHGKFYSDPAIEVESAEFAQYFWSVAYENYAKKFSILKEFGPHKIYSYKIQKTVPTGGYHAWHTEVMSTERCRRVLAFILYLNDVEAGGETEFLYQSRRVEAKEGRLVIWPAGVTHVHRGNAPLKGEKYVLTGWVEF